MASHQPPSSSIWTRPFLLLKVGLARLRAAASFFLMAIPRKFQGWPFRRTLFSAISYSQDVFISAAEVRYLLPVTGTAIKDYCASAGVTDTTETLQCGADTPPATLHYLNSQPQDTGTALLYLHGGGYGNPILATGHVPFSLHAAQAASIHKVVLLEYTLAPGLKYPGQLVQAIAALRHLLQIHKPSEIVIGGDSAGGNLALAVLSHIIEPSSYTSALTLGEANSEKLRGAMILSPWVKFDTSGPGYKYNARTDFLAPPILNEFTNSFKPKRGEVYAEPLVAEAEFWTDLPVKRTIVTAGLWEVFSDDIEALGKKMGARQAGTHGPVELVLAKNESHIQCVVDTAMGVELGFMGKGVLDWARRI